MDSGTSTAARTAAAATGTSAQNADSQPKCASSSPPVPGPAATPRPVTAPYTPMARARSARSGEVLALIDKVVGVDGGGEGAHNEPPGDQRAGAARQAEQQHRSAVEPVADRPSGQQQGGEG